LVSTEGLAVYHHAYTARLIEALADDYPTVQFALGNHNFERLARRVVQAQPSTHPNLNRYGIALLNTLESGKIRIANRSFLIDLARLEWALVEAVHAPPPAALSPSALQAIPPEHWENVRFTPSPSLRLLHSRWPVNDYLQAFREGKAPTFPRRTTGVAPAERNTTAVYRQGFRVWRMSLSSLAAGLLERLSAGIPLGAALEPVQGQAGAERVMQWFQSWVGGGVFSSIALDERALPLMQPKD
jgi:hypothetical protein